MPSRLVLIVEDDPDLLELLTIAFGEAGWNTLGARLVGEAQRLLAEVRVDLAIVDMALPDGTGIEFITWLRSLSPAQGRDTPCIAMTGHPSFGATATAAGFRATLQKPVDIQAIVDLATDVVR